MTRNLLHAAVAGVAALIAGATVWTGPATAARYAPPNCPTMAFHSAPTLNAQEACENLGVTTSGTQPGTYLFLTQGGANGTGAGLFQDNGTLVWWLNGIGPKDHDMSLVHFRGQPYIAVWSGHAPGAGSYGMGTVLLYNQRYQLAGRLRIGKAYGAQQIDLHEFQITPHGEALTGSYTPQWRFVGGHWEWVLGYLVEKWSLFQNSSGIHIGRLRFAWNAINDVRVSDSHVPSPGRHAAIYDYFHGNGITEAPDGDLLVSGRNTWGIYEIDARRGTRGFDHVYWQVGGPHDSRLSEPWCYQHDIAALGHATYSLYDDGGTGPGCLGSSQHPARGLIFGVNTSHRPVRVHLIRSYTHNPAIYTGFTGSMQVLSNGDALIDWANIPQITEYDSTGRTVKMDLSLSNWSYRGFRFPWVGQPTQPPAIAAQESGANTNVWASWNGSTEVAQWQVLGGADASHLAPVGGRVAKTGFETSMTVTGHYAELAVQALSSSGTVLATSNPTPG